MGQFYSLDLRVRVATFVAAGHSRRAAARPVRPCLRLRAPDEDPHRIDAEWRLQRNTGNSRSPVTRYEGCKYQCSGREPTRRIERRLSAAGGRKARPPCSRVD